MFHWFIRHAMGALYPRTAALPGIEDTGLDAFLVEYERESSPLMWLGLVAGTFAFVFSPLFTVYWPVPSFLLTEELLDEHACRVAESRIYLLRQSVFLVKLVAGLCWGSDPKVREAFAIAAYPKDPGTWRAD